MTQASGRHASIAPIRAMKEIGIHERQASAPESSFSSKRAYTKGELS